MVQCDKCMKWYHMDCIKLHVDQQIALADKRMVLWDMLFYMKSLTMIILTMFITHLKL